MKRLFVALALVTTPALSSTNPLSLEAQAFAGGGRGPRDATARYVTIDLLYDPFRRLTEALETVEGIKLKTRGEAHITLLTPPEFEVLAKRLVESEIRSAFDKLASDTPGSRAAEPICVGRGKLGAAKTFYVVVKYRAAFRARQLLAKKFQASGGDATEFKPDVYYPHVTLGFTDRDLHLEDGVIKDARSCLHKLSNR